MQKSASMQKRRQPRMRSFHPAFGHGPRGRMAPVLLAVICLLGLATTAQAADPEGCLTCHQYRGLSRIRDGKNISLFYVDPNYYSQGLGPHARLRCTDCHVRSEVEVFPHRKVSAVDCARACHLATTGNVEKRFGHDRIQSMLGGSAHTQAVLEKSNELLGRPLRDQQAKCLLCHDEPTFRRNGHTFASEEAPIERCGVCHENVPRTDSRFRYWHVHARSQPARTKQDTVRVCALCHSHQQVRQHFKLPDATASYLASFHGKAILLGSQQTASCLDCHVGQMQNVHLIQEPGHPQSSAHRGQLADTCRSPACHPAAGAQISSAAMHMELATTRGVEYFIAFMFIVLILFTFGPSLVLTALKLIQIVVGRQDPQHHEHEHMARRLMQMPEGRRRLVRFTGHQRAQHWLLVVAFSTLVLTGFPMKFADYRWAQWLIGVFGGLSPMRIVHRVAGVVLIAGMFYHMIYLGVVLHRQKRQGGKGWVRTFLELPLVMQPKDMKEMMDLLLYLVGLRKRPLEAGRFNPEEKFEYFGVFWGSVLLGITGVLMWANAWTTQHLPGRVLTVALLVHSFEAFLALLHVGILHMVTVIFSPTVFPISRAMFTGDTPPAELAEAHGALVEQVHHEVLGEHAKPEVSHG